MPRKRFWRRGIKKGISHPSSYGSTIDDDLVNPPAKKKGADNDLVNPPALKKRELLDNCSTIDVDLVNPPAKKKGADNDLVNPPALKKRELMDGLGRRPSNVANESQNLPNETRNVSRNLPNETRNESRNLTNESQNLTNESAKQTVHTETLKQTLPRQLSKQAIANESLCRKAVQKKSCKISNSSAKNHDESRETCIASTHFASHNQADDRYALFSRGSQCTCMSLAMSLSLFENCDFSVESLDKVLCLGDNLYKKVVMDLQNEGTFRSKLLLFDELPGTLEYNSNLYSVTKHSPIFGLPVVDSANSKVFTLHEGLIFAFTKAPFLLLMTGSICSCVVFRNNMFIFFDSHSHGVDGLSAPSGRACLKTFTTIDDLVTYLYSFYVSCNIDLSCQFEALPIEIKRVLHNFPDCNPSTLFNVNVRPVATKTSKRQAYMKSYMQKRRQSQEFKKNERDKKQESRSDKTFRKNEKRSEVESKRIARTDKEFRENEKKSDLDSKRKARTDPTYKEKEMYNKRIARTDEEFRENERKSELENKRSARTDKEFRQNERKSELESKRKARTDPTYKEKEMYNKQIARTDEEFREKERKSELENKRSARTDKEFRQNERKSELESKRKARTDPTYKEKEMYNKQIARTDEEFREKERKSELESKRKARTDPTYKEKEMYNKQIARTDEEFRKNERLTEQVNKRKCRENEQFAQKEREQGMKRKRISRKDSFYAERERLRKQQRRRDTTYHSKERYTDKCRKGDLRTDDSFVQKELKLATAKKYGKCINECTEIFHAKIRTGPCFICSSCHQTWCAESVREVKRESNISFLTGLKSVYGKEWICNTCYTNALKGQIPKLSVANGMEWRQKPKELNLHPLEERLISLRIPFMQIRELPRGGQYCVKGNVVNVPVDVQPTVNSLPRPMDENFTIPVKLKKKLTYKKCDFTENVRPFAVISALHWLMKNSEFYKNSGLTIDESWIQKINNDSSEIVKEFISSSNNVVVDDDAVHCDSGETKKANSDCDGDSDFSEVDADENVTGNVDTLLDDVSAGPNTYVFAPGEGQHPLSLYEDTNSEYLSFPTIFCGQARLNENQREVPVPYSDIAKWELRSKDRRAAHSIPNIFFKLKKLQLKQVSDKVNLAIRRCKTKGKKITAAEARDQSSMDKIVRLDEGYYIFRQLRNSPAYLAARKKDVFAMIRQLGLPAWFMSLSAADTKWFDLLKILAKINNDIDYSDEEVSHWTWKEKTELIRRDPVTCSRFFDHRVQVFLNTVLKSPHNPIGKVSDYFYRVEFQQRGSPHIHMIVWIENSPKYHKDSQQDITDYVDRYVTCSKSIDTEMSDLVSLQTHKHSKTCRKKGKAICRFGFPLPPLRKTVVLEPLEEEIDKYKKKYDQIQQKINSFKDGLSMSFPQFLDEVVELTEEEYIKCIRSSLRGPKIFLKREPSEVRINLYNEKMLKAWNANLDIQFVLDPYACAMYIVSYISKSQRGMSALLDRACKEARQGNMNIKQQVRHIGNKFLNSVEVSAQEASYLILQMPLTKATRDVIFINTSPPDERVFLLKQQSKLEELPSESTDVTCDNVIQRYSKRPSALQNWCLADYAAQLEIKYPDNYEESDDVNDDEIDVNHCNDDGSDTESEDEFSTENTILTLKNGIVIRRRMVDRILRYVHYSLKSDPDNHYREKIMLFYPWRNESVDLLGGCCSYKQHYIQIKNFVESKAKMYEHLREEIEQARLAAEEEHEQHDELAPNAQQSNADDEEEGQTETEEFVHFNPDRPLEHRYYDMGSDIGIASNNMEVNGCGDRMSDDEYNQLARSLNSKQREFFIHVLHWIKTKDEPIYAFLSGGAGVGKSVLIKALYQALHRHLHSTEGEDPDDIRILLCAFTGKAAFNINGITIASAFHKKYNQSNQAMHSEELNTFRVKYRNLKVVIIDEISMVGNKMMNFIDSRLKELTCTNRPFGGISIIAVGDLFQLQPVGDSWIFNDLSDGTQVLANNMWKDHFRLYELTEVMRQKEDLNFANLLNRLRINELTEEDRLEIIAHSVVLNDATYPKDAPHLFCENKFVDSFNKDFVSNLITTKVTVECHDHVVSDVPKSVKEKLLKSLPKDAAKTANLAHSLLIAEGMIYDVTVNLDVKDGLANGSTCVLKFIESRMEQTTRPSIIWVLFADRSVGKATRQKYIHLYSNRIDEAYSK